MIHKILGWVIGIFLIFAGLGSTVSTKIFGFLLIIMGITFIPLFRDWLRKKTKRNISLKSRQMLYGIFVIILMAIMINSSISETNNANNEVKVKREQNRLESIKRRAEILKNKTEEFNNNKDAILSKIKEFKNTKNYSDGLTLANNFIFTNDKDLLELKEEIQTIQRDIQNKLRTKTILSKLKKLPASKINENYNLYKELSKLHPENKNYSKKMKIYDDKISKVEANKIAEKFFYGDQPVQSPWDGSYRVVESYLKQAMNDPSSLDMTKCSSVYKVKDKGWAVKCSYRGKNAFGGMVLNSNWFIIRQNTVVGVEDSNAFQVL